MNKKAIYILLTIAIFILDIALAGRFQSFHFFLIFPVPFFLLAVKNHLDEIVIPGLLYGFLFDVVSLNHIPIMTLFVLGIMGLSWLLKGRFVDISQNLNLYIFSSLITLILFALSAFLSSANFSSGVVYIRAFYILIASSILFLISNFIIEKLDFKKSDEKD